MKRKTAFPQEASPKGETKVSTVTMAKGMEAAAPVIRVNTSVASTAWVQLPFRA